MQYRSRLDLQTEIWRRPQKETGLCIVCDGYLGLSSSFTPERSSAQSAAVPTVAVPLGKPAACGRAQDFDAHKLHRGANVGVDLAIQRDLFKLRCRPFHNSHP